MFSSPGFCRSVYTHHTMSTPPRPGVAAPGFRPRIGPILDERRSAVFQDLRSASLLNRLTGPSMPFGWTVNPYRGCEVGCAYCYARPTHEFLGHTEPAEFEERIYVKRAEGRRLHADLLRARESGLEIALGTATDPYQPAEARFGVTRSVLEAIAEVPGLRVSLTTKSARVAGDLGLLQRIAASSEIAVNLSLISLDGDLLRVLEPRAPRPELRLAAIRALTGGGIRARLFIMPVLPLITDAAASLRALIEAARDAGAREVIANTLFLRGSTRPFFLELIAREFPWALARYEELYPQAGYAPREYQAWVQESVERLCRAAGLVGRGRDERIRREAPARPRQLALTW